MKKGELIVLTVLTVLTVLLWGVIGAKLWFGEIKVSLSSRDPIRAEMRKTLENTNETKKIAIAVKEKVEQEIGAIKKDVGQIKQKIDGVEKKIGIVKSSTSTATTAITAPTKEFSQKFYLAPPNEYQNGDIEKVVIKGKDVTGEFKKELLSGEKTLISLKEGLSVIKYTMYLTDNEKINGKIEISLTAKGNVTFIIGGGR